MPQENVLTAVLARVAGIPFRILARKPYVPPRKALILHPCCLSQVMLATPLLAVLSQAYPQAQIDWAVSDWARPAISTNPRLTELIRTGPGAVQQMNWQDIRLLIQHLRQESYDTCFVPGRSAFLAYIAWQAGIPQRIGLNIRGRGFAHTLAVPAPAGERHAAAIYLALASAIGLAAAKLRRPVMEFYPSDADRTVVTEWLIDDLDWLGDVPLIIMHPGGGQGSAFEDEQKRWPVERFVLLGNHLARHYGARILIVGSERTRSLADAIVGMMSAPATSWAGRISLGKLGALGEMADLYVGNDTGPTHIAAAVGCPTLALFGPSNPAFSAPYGKPDRVTILWQEQEERPFTWAHGVTVAEAIKAAEKLLARKPSSTSRLWG
jgi:heptosyltransferase-2